MKSSSFFMVCPMTEAILTITYEGHQGDLEDPLPYDLPDNEVLRIAQEAVSSGVTGIPNTEADFTDFVVNRYPARDGLPNRISLRPKTPFGSW